MAPQSEDLFQAWRALLAGASGSIVQLGIGPIVTASIVLQLLKGADILHIDTSETRGQVMYMGLQKILIMVMIVIEAAPNLVGGFIQPDPVIAQQFFGGNLFAVSFLIFIQICIGGLLIFFMDEVVTKWGIGSGVGLFIIAGISQALVNGFIQWAAVADPYPVGFFPRARCHRSRWGKLYHLLWQGYACICYDHYNFPNHCLCRINAYRDPARSRSGEGCTGTFPGQTHLRQCPANDPRQGVTGKHPDDWNVPLQYWYYHIRDICWCDSRLMV